MHGNSKMVHQTIFSYAWHTDKSLGIYKSRGFSKAQTGFEPVIRVLQTHALPLGYCAIMTPTGIEPVLPP